VSAMDYIGMALAEVTAGLAVLWLRASRLPASAARSQSRARVPAAA
jgi:hypothetical protein